jgi:hypothetical protein
MLTASSSPPNSLLAITPVALSVMAFPRLPSTGCRVIKLVTFTQASRFLARGSKTARFPMLVDRVDDPVDLGVTADGFVLGVDEDDFKVFVSAVLVDPVRVQDSQIGAASADSLFRSGFERSLIFQLVDSLVRGFSYEEG